MGTDKVSFARPKAIVLDVLVTIASTKGVKNKLMSLGFPADAADLWFTRCQRDGVCASIAGNSVSMGDVAQHNVHVLAAELGLSLKQGDVEGVLQGFAESDLIADVPNALTRLHQAGIQIGTFTNGLNKVTYKMFGSAGLQHLLDADLQMQVSEAAVWKPDARAYQHYMQVIKERKGWGAQDLVYVSAQQWDIQGAATAGMQTVLVTRHGEQYAPFLKKPDVIVKDFSELADVLVAL